MSHKLGKNEAKRLAAAARAELDDEVDDEKRERELRRGMGLETGSAEANSKFEERAAAQKQTKEEKEAAKAAAKERLAAKRAEKAEAKEAEAAMRAAIEANRKAIAAAALAEAGGGGEGGEGDGGGDGGEGGPSYSANYDEEGNTDSAVDLTDDIAPAAAADAPAAAKGGKASKTKASKGGGSSKSAGGKKGKESDAAAAAAAAKAAAKAAAASDEYQGLLRASDDLPFFQKSGPSAKRRITMDRNVKIGGIRMCAGKQELLDSAVLALNYGVKYGLVGRNGVGKTTLLRQLAEGQIALPKFLNVVHVEQEITGDHRSALRTIVEADEEREWLLKVEEMLIDGDETTERELRINLNEVYERLEEIDSDNADARAAQLLAGLGFDKGMQEKPTREYSGGWRMRIALAAALYVKPDLLLLDEPTNHLDVHALTWLEFFLAGWERTVLIVSHDRGFLNKVSRANDPAVTQP